MTAPTAPDFASALRRCADDPSLVAWHGGAHGHAGLAWEVDEHPVTSFAHLRDLLRAAGPMPTAPETSPEPDIGRAWDRLPPGGWWIQLDYEFPAVPGRAWRPRSWWSWTPDGRATCHTRDGDPAAAARFLARPSSPCPAPRARTLIPAWDRAGHRQRVEDIRARIAAGEIYQANLTLPFTAALDAPAPGADPVRRDLGLFLALTGASPAGFAACLRGGGRTVISHSPECLLSARADALASLPIKGTRRRHPGRDAEIRAELLASPKDRAELAMIVDLVRNDLGRVAAPRSVVVADPAALLDLPHLHHLVATVFARARPGCDAIDALAALYPAGSVVGAPKLRAQQVLRALEAGPRGPYCGTFGWLAHTPTGIAADLAVAIRTLVIADDRATLHAGGGIVADSDPDREWEEACAKASAMATALGVTLADGAA